MTYDVKDGYLTQATEGDGMFSYLSSMTVLNLGKVPFVEPIKSTINSGNSFLIPYDIKWRISLRI